MSLEQHAIQVLIGLAYCIRMEAREACTFQFGYGLGNVRVTLTVLTSKSFNGSRRAAEYYPDYAAASGGKRLFAQAA
jgi:hypothetical protein